MKQVMSIVLILLLSAQCLIQLGFVASYQFNKEYIVKSFCKNRDIPEMNCEGKCFLKKRLADAEKHERQASGIEKQLEMPLFLIVIDGHTAVGSFARTESNPSLITNYMHITYVNIFHPPSAGSA